MRKLILVAAVCIVVSMGVGVLGQEPTPGQINVCLKQEITTEEKMVPHREPTQVATTTWCFSLPPRCTTYKTVYKVVYKPEVQQIPKMVTRCCDGYTLHSNGTCVPLCMNQCINGQCVAPNKCDCNPGYAGDTCTQSECAKCTRTVDGPNSDCECPAAKWGPQCTKECKCQNGGSCDSISGKCECEDGWQGESCQDACPSGQYGRLCLQSCRCQNGAKCNPITGACQCAAGFCGPLCDTKCLQDKALTVCDRCQNGGFCSGDANNCTCPSGWTGEVCASQCEEGSWGKECAKTCRVCHNHGKCDPANGACKCPAGYWGVQCERQCEPGRFGPNCQNTCDCENARTCDPINGHCTCFLGFQGDRCDMRACPEGKYGKYCNESCACGNLTVCHPLDGSCICQESAVGKSGSPACSMCCIVKGGDSDCYSKCQPLSEKWICATELGGCVCLPDYSGPECRVSLSLTALDANNAAELRSGPHTSHTDNTGLIVGLVLAFLVLILLLALAVFYRRRVRKLQNELATVTYSTSTGASGGSNSDNEDGDTLNRADNFLYLGPAKTTKDTSVQFGKKGETFVKVAEAVGKKPAGNMYVSMPKLMAGQPSASSNDQPDDSAIYQSVVYEIPRHYATIEDGGLAESETPSPMPLGHTNRAFENQLYNQKQAFFGNAPPSYDAVITETMTSSNAPNKA